MHLAFAYPFALVAVGQWNGVDGWADRGHYLGGRGVVEVGVGVALRLNSPLPVDAEHRVFVPRQAQVIRHVAQWDAAEELVLQRLHLLAARHHALQGFVGEVQVQRAPHGDIPKVRDAATVGLAHLEVDQRRAVLVGQRAYRHAIRGGHQGVGHIAPLDACPEGVGTVVIGHEHLATGLPVVFYGIRVYVGALPHDVLRLPAQLA